MEDKLNTILGKESAFKGNSIKVTGGLRIDGKLEGDIEANSIFIGEKGEIEGNIVADFAVIGGKVKGDVIAREAIELQKNAILIGNIETKSIMIDKGVTFEGFCSMGVGREKKQRQKPKKTKVEKKVEKAEELPTITENDEGTKSY
jgi:cytoskeletal protein CcmA (bactofilin family)